MASHTKGKTQPVNWSYSPRQSHLPPKSPFPSSMAPTFVEYGPSHFMGQKSFPHASGGYRQHQRTSSESFLIEEQPSWLDDLLNEPETPVKKGSHRRSASDSVAFLENPIAASRIENIAEEEEFDISNLTSLPSWGSSNFDRLDKENRASNSYQAKTKKPPIRSWETSARESHKTANLGTSSLTQDADNDTIRAISREEPQEHDVYNAASSGLEGIDSSLSKLVDPDMDPKRAKQQFAQRSRVRKLQYISELERNVSVLQAEESEVSAEVAFLNQQRLILTLENQALKQRVAGLAQEKMIKDAEHELLMKEVQRLKLLYQQQQFQQHPSLQSSTLQQIPSSLDFDLQQLPFSKLNLGTLKQESKPALGSGSFGLVKQMGGLSLGVNKNDEGMTCRNGSSEVFKGNIPSACMIAGTGKKHEGRR